ncbi:flippase [Candidatus Pacearchaeota archaeon]|nr:flippase [Candidatus Pacearchaeota archaeon]
MKNNHNTEVNKSLWFIVKGSIIVLIGLFISKILTYIYKIIIAKNFGPESYGLFSLALIITTLFSTVASLGLSEGLLRYISLYSDIKNFKKIKFLLNFSVISSCISGLFFAILLFIFSNKIAIGFFHNRDLIIYLRYFSLSVPLILFSNLFLSVIKSSQQIVRYTFLVNIFQNSLKLIVLLILIIIGLSSHAIIGSYLISLFGLTIAAYFGSKYYIQKVMVERNLSTKDKFSLTKEFILYSWPVIFVSFAGTFLYWIDSLVIGYLIDTVSVGIYSAAFTVVSILGIAPELFMQLFLPIIVRDYVRGRGEIISQISKQVSKWIWVLNIPVFTFLIIFPKVIINLLFGSQYLEATESLRILAIGGFFSSFIPLTTSLLSMKGKSKSILLTILIAAFLNIVLGWILVSNYGIKGAAIATSFVWFLTLSIYLIQVYLSTKIFPLRRKLIYILGISFIPAFGLFYFQEYLSSSKIIFLIGAVIYLLIYLMILFISKCFDKNDILMMRNLFSALKYKSIKILPKFN